MKSTNTNIQRLIEVMFWLFLVGSPILAYIGGMLYTDVQFRVLTKKVQNLPIYPGVRLISNDFTDFNYDGHSYHWELKYETDADMKEVIAFYQRTLPQSDWVVSWADQGASVYKSGDLSMMLYQDNSMPGNKTFFGLSVISRYYSTVFDLRYSE